MSSFEHPERVPGIAEFIPEKVAVLVFDVDDTVTRGTQRIKQQAWPELFADKLELLQEALEKYERTGAGDRYNIIAYIIGVDQDKCHESAEVAKLAQQFEDLTVEKIRAGGIHRDDLAALVELHKNFPGKMPLLSATPEATVQGNIAHFETMYPELRGMFGPVIGTPMSDGKAGELIKITKAHGLEPDELLMVGDGGSDHDGATRAGTQFVAVVPTGANDKWPHESFPKVSSIAELPSLLS